jgi:hypothetical protein
VAQGQGNLNKKQKDENCFFIYVIYLLKSLKLFYQYQISAFSWPILTWIK